AIIVYTMMSTRISRSGGDYVWVSRAFGGWLGGSLGWLGGPLALMGYYGQTLAYEGLVALTGVVAIGTVAVSLGYQNMLPLALTGTAGANVAAQFMIATLMFAILVLVNIFRPKVGFKIVTV